MKRHAVLFGAFVFIIINACNNKKTETKDTGGEVKLITGDTLMTTIMDDHNIGMARMGRLGIAQGRIQSIIDSIERLPAKSKQALAPYKIKLDKLFQDLKTAKSGMEKWMDEFNMDSAVNDAKKRMKYLTDEKLKVSKVKDNILSSLQRADSLIKEKL